MHQVNRHLKFHGNETGTESVVEAGIQLKEMWVYIRHHAIPFKDYFSQFQKLRIENTRSQDGGIYVCVAVSKAGSAQQAYTLDVLVPPKIQPTVQEITVPQGRPFSLKCFSKGHPEPSVMWQKEEEQIGSTVEQNVSSSFTEHNHSLFQHVSENFTSDWIGWYTQCSSSQNKRCRVIQMYSNKSGRNRFQSLSGLREE